MPVAKQRRIARMGGIIAHRQGRAHQWTHDEAKAAGRKGGLTRAKQRAAKLAEQTKA